MIDETDPHAVPLPVEVRMLPLEPALLLLSYKAPVIRAEPSTWSFWVGEVVPMPTLPAK